MNPSKKGWLKKYLDRRSELQLTPADSASDHEQYLYRLLQPTGIMYGHPLQHPLQDHLNLDQCDHRGLMKLILTESFLQITSASGSDLSDNQYYKDQQVPNISSSLNRFYLGIYPGLHRKPRKDSDSLMVTESIIDKRLSIQSVDLKNYLTTFFHNSLLFLDLYYYWEWINVGSEIDVAALKEKKQDMRFNVLKIMAAAAQSDYALQKEERALFQYFLESAEMSKAQEKEARSFLNKPLTLAELELPGIDSWILRKYFLEIAILTAWADKKITRSEKDFLFRLGRKLGFSGDELSRSLLAVESFTLENWKDINYLLGKQELQVIKRRYVRRIKGFVNKNKEYVIQEIQESRELVILMNKSRRETLSKEEKEKVRKQLIDILKTVPTFVIIALPFTFITLPVLLSLLPKSAFPSAFQD